MKLAIVFLIGLLTMVASAEKQPFERYQSIIDRQMFGPLPPGFDPTKLPSEVQKSSSAEERELTKEQEQLKSAIHFSVINVAADGKTEVGFTDNSDPKMPRHYFLKVGESRDGWTVKEADAETAKMTIVKDEIEVTLTLGGNSASDAGSTSRTGVAAARPQTTAFGGRSGGLLGGSLRARRLQRRQAEAAAKAQADAAAAEKEAAQAAREAERQAQAEQEKVQREAERAEQRQQLQAIQEELKRVREAKAAAEAAKANEGESAQNDAQ